MKILIKNANCSAYLLGRNAQQKILINLVIEDGKILTISESPIRGDFQQSIDATGLFLSPGLVDPQVHLRNGDGVQRRY